MKKCMWYVCVCACIYLGVCLYVCVPLFLFVLCVPVQVFMCMFVCTSVHVCMCLYLCVCACVRISASVYVCAYRLLRSKGPFLLPSFAFYSCDKDYDLGKDQDNGEVLQLTVLPCRTSRQELKEETQRVWDLKQRPWWSACLLTYSPYKSQDHLPRDGTSHRELSPPIYQSSNEKIPYYLPTSYLVEAFSQLRSTLPKLDPILCQVDKN